MRATLLSSGKGYLTISPWYTTGLIYIVSLNHPIFLPTRNQKRVRCPVCFQTYYGPFVLWSFLSFPFSQGSPVARVKADSDSSGLPGNVSISLLSLLIRSHQNFQTSPMALLLPHRTQKFLQNFEPHLLPLFLNDRRVLHEDLRLGASLRLHLPRLSRRKVLFGHQLGMVSLLVVDRMRWEQDLQRDLVLPVLKQSMYQIIVWVSLCAYQPSALPQLHAGCRYRSCKWDRVIHGHKWWLIVFFLSILCFMSFGYYLIMSHCHCLFVHHHRKSMIITTLYYCEFSPKLHLLYHFKLFSMASDLWPWNFTLAEVSGTHDMDNFSA